MKKYHEKGATGIDIVGGMVIFAFASVLVVNLYYQIYVTTVSTKVHQVAIGCVTEVFEKIDLEDYDNITEAKIEEFINNAKMNEYFNEEKNSSHVEYSITNYAKKTSEDKDILKKINITVVYNIGGNEVTFPMSKIKVRE